MTRAQQQTCDYFWRVARIGSRVINKNDPRHAGRICRINWQVDASVRWDSGIVSHRIPMTDLWPERALRLSVI